MRTRSRGLSRAAVDGCWSTVCSCPRRACPGRAVVRGDATVPEIMAASILAKTARATRGWTAYAMRSPGYGFEKHKGYPTREHRAAIARLGPCAIHRRSFRLLG